MTGLREILKLKIAESTRRSNRQRFQAELEIWQPRPITTSALEQLTQQVPPETMIGRGLGAGGIFVVTPSGSTEQYPEDGSGWGATEIIGNPSGYFAIMYRYLGKNQWEEFRQPMTIISDKYQNLIDGLRKQDDRFNRAFSKREGSFGGDENLPAFHNLTAGL